jgi:tetratricopeptide (TPR) repeat protein
VNLTPDSAQAGNNLAWYLVTCPDPEFHHASRAVELAARAVELAPLQGTYWNTLGVAQYRAGEWQAAIESLHESMELRNGGDACDWFFLAMAKWQLKQQDEAKTWYDKAVEWTDRTESQDEDLRLFRAEAAELLGITTQQPDAAPILKP